ncbi:MAG: SDR family NAD(P)-dependent oxidoreductase [Oligoflexia bacterium]|nr:SDR family NAD(P)-dependent oxidoreductase [Oligoflexia bacterium]
MIFITGASSGIGEATARAFASRKKNLILTARRLDRIQALARELSAAYGIEAHAFALDVRDRQAVSALVESRKELFSRVTVLVNNAGLAKGLDPFHSGAIDDWELMIDTNLKGLVYVSRAVLPLMVAAGHGHIVHVGSIAGHWNYPKGNVYSATKAGVHALTESMRLDLSGTGLRVTEIAPGMVETEFSEVRLGDRDRAKAVYAGMKPLSAADVADTILWAVERPAHINIQQIVLYPTDQASPTVVHRRTP